MLAKEVLRQHIAETILFSKEYPYADSDSFLENGVIDSMNVIELVLFLEQQFGIKLQITKLFQITLTRLKNWLISCKPNNVLPLKSTVEPDFLA
jgi:acyl carrier protein